MKLVNRGLALLLAAVLAIPTLPARAEELPDGGDVSFEQSIEESEDDDSMEEDIDDLEETDELGEGDDTETPDDELGEDDETETTDDELGEEDDTETPDDELGDDETETPDDETGEGDDTETPDDETGEEDDTETPDDELGEEDDTETPDDETGEEDDTETPDDELEEEDESDDQEEEDEEELEEDKNIPDRAAEVRFNTGNCEFSIVDLAVSEEAVGDDIFEEDGSFTINIQEENPFFPYEVQFTCDGETTTEWFMTPDDTVEIGGHTFYVSASMDGTVITQMNLEVGGKTVIGYPARKEFTNNGSGVMPVSLLPLEERTIWFDLYNFTPVELSIMQVKAMLSSSYTVLDTDKVIWHSMGDNNYRINAINDKIDLSYDTYYGYSCWEMFVGESDQLAGSNVKYNMYINTRDCLNWLIPTVYSQDEGEIRTNIQSSRNEYYDYDYENRRLYIDLAQKNISNGEKVFVSLAVDESLFTGKNYDKLKVYDGKYTNVTEAMAATDITGLVCAGDMTQVNAGYEVSLNDYNQWITLVTFSENGTPTGCLPISLVVTGRNNDVRTNNLKAVGETRNVWDTYSTYTVDGCRNIVYTLYKDEEEYDGEYAVSFYYSKAGTTSNADVTAAYVGQYSSISEAAGKENIKNSLFGTGYSADFSEGVYFTVFVGEDNDANQEVYKYYVKTKIGENYRETYLSTDTSVRFYGLDNGYDGESNYINILGKNTNDDSYGENNYFIMLVPQGTDLSDIIPSFSLGYNAKMYTSGSSTPEVSGVTSHDFSNGPIQYTVVAEDGEHQKNYWLSIIAGTSAYGSLYINSFDDAESNTKIEENIVHSTREVMLDSQHKDIHDIWITNTGTEAIDNLSVTLVSDAVELDEYWTLHGKYSLEGMPSENNSAANMAKVRLLPKEGVDKGTEVNGTLTFKSGDTTLVVLNLTGTVGDPAMITKEIPQAVKYVPYGTVIQNSNKYSWNQVSYVLRNGRLPQGMEVKPNGEIYGVPKESGEFTFTVRMDNSYSKFEYDEKTYTLIVQENTDANVDSAVDEGYDLSGRVQDIDSQANASNSQTLVSEGEFTEFVDLYLDGEKLVKNTDYTAESGSTRITIMNQTLAREGVGTHTLGIEFRTADTDTLKRAAQNYEVTSSDGDSENGGNEGTGGNEETGGSAGTGGNEGTGGSAGTGGNEGIGESAETGGSAGTEGSTGTEENRGTEESGENIETEEDAETGENEENEESVEIEEDKETGENTEVEEGVVAESISYTIQSGDTLWKIAVKYFGDGNQWRKILEDNKATITNPDKIYVGQILIINVTLNNAGENVSNTTNTEVVDGIYTVKAGDTLWKISKKVYGTGIFWRRLLNANEESIKDASRIYVGQVIKIP